MEAYRKVVQDIEKERANFLSKIDFVQPSYEEQHQLEWGSRYQKEELALLQEETERASRELDAEISKLRERDELIRSILEEQHQDRVKIQTLLALSQPITPDITVVFESLGPVAPAGKHKPPPRGPSPRGRPFPSRRQRSPAPEFEGNRSCPIPGVTSGDVPITKSRGGGGRGPGAQTSPRRTCASLTREVNGESEAGEGCRQRGELARVWRADGTSGMIHQDEDSSGTGGEVQGESAEVYDDDGAPYQRGSPRQNLRSRIGIGSGANYPTGAESSEVLERGRTWDKSQRQQERQQAQGRDSELDESGPIAECLGGWSAETRAGRGDDEAAEGKHEIMALAGSKENDDGDEKSREGLRRLRCARGYRQLLTKRLELTQRHLEGIERLSRDYHEALQRDAHEREIQAQVQRQNIATVAKTLRKRVAEVDERLVQGMDEYLRLRHLAKEAHAASSQEQREQSQARQKLEKELQKMDAAAELQRDVIARDGQLRLEDETEDLREMLKRAEGVLQGERSRHRIIRERYTSRLTRARESLLLLKRQHRALVARRAKELVHLNNEVSALRRGVTELERIRLSTW